MDAKPHVTLWPHGKVFFTYPLVLLWTLFLLLHLSGVKSEPWFARINFIVMAFVLVVVFIDFRRNVAMIALVVGGLVLTIALQAAGVAIFFDMANAVEKYSTGFSVEFHFLLAMLLIVLMGFDIADTILNRRIKIDDKHIEMLRPGDDQKLHDLNQVIVEYRMADYWEWLLLGTGTIFIYSKNGSDKGMLIAKAEHVIGAQKLYEKIQEFINVD